MTFLHGVLIGFGVGLGVGGVAMWALLRFYAWRKYVPWD